MVHTAQIARQDQSWPKYATLFFVSPIELYSQQLAQRKERLASLDALNARIEGTRLAIGASFLIIAWLCFGPVRLAAAWLCVPIAGFAALLVYHLRIRSRRTQALRAVQHYAAGLDRIQDRWSGKGTTGSRFEAQHHIYGDDLDLFGVDSLFELLCAARTQLGENILAQWLLAPADIQTIRARHASITDLRGRIEFRESTAIDGDS